MDTVMPEAVRRQNARADELLNQPPTSEAEYHGTPGKDASLAPPAPRATAEDWEQKFKTLLGKYNGEVPRLHTQLKQQSSKIAEMEAAITSLQATPPKPKEPAYLRNLSEEERERYEPETLMVSEKVASAVVDDRVQALEAKNEQLARSISETKTALVLDRVEMRVPGAKKVNESDPNWFAWLDGRNPDSGIVRKESGSAAIQSGDIDTLVDLFTEYMTAAGIQPGSMTIEERLATQARPGSVPTASVVGAAEKPHVRMSEIKAFQADFTKGRYRTRPQEAQRLMDEYDNALMEGRIIEDI